MSSCSSARILVTRPTMLLSSSPVGRSRVSITCSNLSQDHEQITGKAGHDQVNRLRRNRERDAEGESDLPMRTQASGNEVSRTIQRDHARLRLGLDFGCEV